MRLDGSKVSALRSSIPQPGGPRVWQVALATASWFVSVRQLAPGSSQRSLSFLFHPLDAAPAHSVDPHPRQPDERGRDDLDELERARAGDEPVQRQGQDPAVDIPTPIEHESDEQHDWVRVWRGR